MKRKSNGDNFLIFIYPLGLTPPPNHNPLGSPLTPPTKPSLYLQVEHTLTPPLIQPNPPQSTPLSPPPFHNQLEILSNTCIT